MKMKLINTCLAALLVMVPVSGWTQAGSEPVRQALSSNSNQLKKGTMKALLHRGLRDVDITIAEIADVTRDSDPEIRLLAMQVLLREANTSLRGREKVSDLMPAISERLKDPDPKVRALAARMVGAFPSKRSPISSAESLKPLTADPNASVRFSTLHAMKLAVRGSDNRANRDLLHGIVKNDPGDSIRGAAAQALARMKPNKKSVDVLIAALENAETANEQKMIMSGLMHMGPAAVKALPTVEAIHNDPNVPMHVKQTSELAIKILGYHR